MIDSFRFSHVAAAVFIFCASAPPAQAATLPRLVVVRPSEAQDCPDAPTLALAVEKQMHRPALDPKSEDASLPTYEVTVSRGKDGYGAVIRSGDSTRELSDPGSTCAELADAMALTLAILLDSDATAEPAPPPPPVHVEPIPAKPVSQASKPMTHPKAILRIVTWRSWHVGGDVSAGETLGFLEPLSFALDGGVFIRYRRSSIGLGVFAIPSATIKDATNKGVAEAYIVAARMNACVRIVGNAMAVNASLCGQGLLGAIHASGNDYVENRQGSQPWFGLGPMALLQGPFSPVWGWSLRLSLIAPVIHQRFISTRIEGTGSNARETSFTLFESPSVAGFLGAGVHFTIL